ncbi:MAG: type II toxin-antitoxin system HicB family antitoxin [Sedimenticola sp.]
MRDARDMTHQYIALIRKDRDTDYCIVPDVPGCYASGKTKEEAKAIFEQAL